jgi:hypothetical protein
MIMSESVGQGVYAHPFTETRHALALSLMSGTEMAWQGIVGDSILQTGDSQSKLLYDL